MTGSERHSRRGFTAAATKTVAALWLGVGRAEFAALFAGLDRQPAPPPTILTPVEMNDLTALTSLIFPSDGTPGAKEAQVARFIDRALGSLAAEQLELFRTGLANLRVAAAKRRPPNPAFSALGEADQIALVEALDRAKSPFFEAVRTATIMGMFAHPKYGGNEGKLGWRMIDFQDRGVWQAPFGDYDRPGPSK